MASNDDYLDDDEDEDNPIWAALTKTGLILSIVVLAGGYMGWFHPLGDSLSVLRGPAAIAVCVLSLLGIRNGMQAAAFGALLLSILAATSVVLAHVWPGPPGIFLLYQKNMYYQNSDLAGLEADIRDAAPLALTLQEVSDPNRALLTNLQDVLPHQLHCPLGRRGGTAVASQLPPVAGATVCVPGLSAMQVMFRDQPVWIVSVHLSWPWPFGQAAEVAELRPVLAGLEGPVLMGGDFNMVRWGLAVRRLAAEARGQFAGPSKGSFTGLWPLPSLPIDHVIAPGGGRITQRPALGSDHVGLLANLAL
jgi:endonuclease/exonuclease/phosphatase (EEP) superfamily protein YafD